MNFNPFQIAADRAQQSYAADQWLRLSIPEQSTAIYRELRQLDVAMMKRWAATRHGRGAGRPVSGLRRAIQPGL